MTWRTDHIGAKQTERLLWKKCGATPCKYPFSEVYSSLQKNMYDGMLIPTETLQSCNLPKYANTVKLNLSYASPGTPDEYGYMEQPSRRYQRDHRQ